MLNAITSGRLIRDPESLTSKAGTEYATATVAVPVGTENDQFVKLIAFRDRAPELLALAKGDAVSATGTLKARGYTDKNTGEPRAALELVVDRLLTLPPAQAARPQRSAASQYKAAAEAQRSPGKDLEDDVPW
jgi:single-stranded DNA-binding protein